MQENFFVKIGGDNMKKLYYVYVLGKFCNPCYIKLGYNQIDVSLFFIKQGYKILSVILAE